VTRSDIVRAAAVVAAVLVIGLVALNVTNAAPLPTGPLGDHQALDSSAVDDMVDYQPGESVLYIAALVENTGPFPVTVIRVTPLGVTVPGSVEVLGSLPFNRDDPAERGSDGLDRIVLGLQPDPGPAWASPEPVTGVTVEPKGSASDAGRAFLVRITRDPSQETAVYGFDVEYTIGPFHLITTAWGAIGTHIVLCGRDRPMSGSDGCHAG